MVIQFFEFIHINAILCFCWRNKWEAFSNSLIKQNLLQYKSLDTKKIRQSIQSGVQIIRSAGFETCQNILTKNFFFLNIVSKIGTISFQIKCFYTVKTTQLVKVCVSIQHSFLYRKSLDYFVLDNFTLFRSEKRLRVYPKRNIRALINYNTESDIFRKASFLQVAINSQYAWFHYSNENSFTFGFNNLELPLWPTKQIKSAQRMKKN